MIIGIIMAAVAGAFVSLQNVFNSKVNERAGSWITTTLVLGLGFLASFMIGLLVEGKHLFMLDEMKPWYWFSGVIGVGVVVCLVQSIKRLGPTFAISIVMASQLGFAIVSDSLGLLGLKQVPFTGKQFLAVIVIVTGMLVFKMSGKKELKRERTA
ncbi:DMT family transporter [Guptibacillus hwajinpoensis]|uniref:Transporter family-2 protein n=1 Tax=Guptibacillus hwajinpoensis TaxID=208199 RepID=A0ABU0JYD0_9BACL|nr:DMT family transporter [Alkalihalobacillus hemicentroti]MDQ0481119.1 transporter family-2 protein [Alkalihalobacillus hemicentroti]